MIQEAEEKSLVLDSELINQKIIRMAFEIYENNFKEKVIVLAGVDGQGYTLAKSLAKEIEAISPLKIIVVKVVLDKRAPEQSEISLDVDPKELKKKCIIITDDVLNTGRTLAFAMKPFLEIAVKKVEVAVLVNRSHSLFPILPQYTGYQLTTTLTEHVEVILGKKSAVYLH
jgi:pyrimidine operon attenuation protein / uracil phosphoribosyltransferase